MNKKQLFNFPYYEFFNNSIDTNELISQAKNTLIKTPNIFNEIYKDPSGNRAFYNKELLVWIQSCIDTVSKNEFDNMELVVTDCWFNSTSRYQKHHEHFHPNSILSGIFYLTDSDVGTCFSSSNPWTEWLSPVFSFNPTLNTQTTIVSAEKGKLIIFPSNILHFTKPNTSNNIRYSIAFNTFFNGSFGWPIADLDINTKSKFKVSTNGLG